MGKVYTTDRKGIASNGDFEPQKALGVVTPDVVASWLSSVPVRWWTKE